MNELVIKHRKQNISDTITIQEKIISFLIVLWPILNIYGIGGDSIGFGDCVIIPYCLYLFIVNIRKYRYIVFSYFLFFSICIIISVFSYLLCGYSIERQTLLSLVKDFIYVFTFSLVAPKNINMTYLFKVYKVIVIILSALVVVQVAAYYLFGYMKPFVFYSPIFTLKDVGGYQKYMVSWYNYIPVYGFKVSSIFSEPAKFAQYVAPCFFLSFFDEKKKKNNLFFEIFITAVVYLTHSANGVVYMSLGWFMWILLKKNNKNAILRNILLVFFFTITICFLFVGNSNIWFINRFREIGDSGINSGNMRVLRGWKVFGQLNIIQKIIGVGFDNCAQYISNNNIVTGYDGGYIGYMSGMSEIFVSGGILCGVLFVLLCIKYLRYHNDVVTSLVGLMLVILFASAILNGPSFGLLIAIIESCIQANKKEDRVKYFEAYMGKKK